MAEDSIMSIIYGTTFSPLQCEYLGLDYRETFLKILQKRKFELIRLGAYWNQIEGTAGEYQFNELDWLLAQCRDHGVKVMLTVGMKAPRWPEFHLPKWVREDLQSESLQNETLDFVERVVQHVQIEFAEVIEYFQVENEPFHKFDVNANRALPYSLVAREIQLVRKYLRPHQKIALTCGLSMTVPLFWQDLYAMVQCVRLADAVGFNVYVKMGVEGGRYITTHPLFFAQLKMYRWIIERFGKKTFIAEMQDEPWEHGAMVHVGKVEYPSWSEQQTAVLLSRLESCGFRTILEWGCEWHNRAI